MYLVDLPEYYIPVEYDVSGWKQLPEILLLHHHNAFGMRAEVVSAAKETFLRRSASNLFLLKQRRAVI